MKKKNSFSQSVLSLLLVFLMVMTLFPTSAFAVGDDSSEHIHIEDCSHEEESKEATEEGGEETVASEEMGEDTTPIGEPSEEEKSEEPAPEEEVSQLVYSGTVGESAVLWSFNPANGRLTITGSGGCDTFRSAEDQPWAHLRTEICEVSMDNMEMLSIENLAFWFEGCTKLEAAEIPYYTEMIGTKAFANCPALTEIRVYYYDDQDFFIVPGAFATEVPSGLTVSLITDQQKIMQKLSNYDWSADNRQLMMRDVYSYRAIGDCYLTGCNCATCTSHYVYAYVDSSRHLKHVACTNCSAAFGLDYYPHSYGYDGICSDCGYYDASYDNSVCYHYATRTSWSGCDWYEYCQSCNTLVDYGTSHGTYTYGAWQYYSTSQHRRSYACSDCGTGSYTYGYHSTTTTYTNYSTTQHTVGSYCSTCASYVGSTTKESHSFSYGSWTNDDATQHRRTKSCSSCGYSTYEYANHSLSYGSYTSYSATQHRRKVSCSCGYSTYEYVDHTITTGSWASASDTQHSRTKSCSVCSYSTAETGSHSITNGTWASISATQHQRTKTCSCGYSTVETADHTITHSAWVSISEENHQRTNSCSCGYSVKETVAHSDGNADDYCDSCNFLLSRFSVTVPANLGLMMASNGEMCSATTAAIINNSTDAVEVTAISITAAGDWTLVPFNYNMAAAKVDSKLIGFSINGVTTSRTGRSEQLSLSGDWTIAKGASLPLTYDAVASATSVVINNEQVLTLVFVIDWVDR